jgi:transposase
MYQVLDKDTIKTEIMPHLATAKRGYKTKSDMVEIINSILYKLKTGCQWHLLPVEGLFTEEVLSYQAVYWHFRKWCKNGSWKDCWIKLLSNHKTALDLSSVDIDGSHTPALRGGEEVAYQGRKKKKTTSSLYLTDRQGLPLALSSPVAGNHHDLYQIEIALDDLFGTVSKAGILLDGLFANADSGFDSENFRKTCLKKGIFPNVAFNYRNGTNNDEIYLLDELLYEERYSIERTNAWMDSYRSVLNRFDTTTDSWESFNYIAFIVILLKKIKKNKKSK